MISSGSKRYWRAMFEGENGDFVKNILTDGRWNPSGVGGVDYGKDEEAPLAFKIIFTILLIILVGAGVFGIFKLLEWIW